MLGALIEKSLTTPEYYPLSQNALTLACNQKSNRDPVMELDEEQVAGALAELVKRQMAYEVPGSRTMKYGQNFTRLHGLVGGETAALCVLLLRGPQTPGEIKGRTGRMKEWESLDEVESALGQLIERGYAVRLPRSPGRKEHRYAHLLAGAPMEADPPREVPDPPARDGDPLAALEDELRTLRAELEEVRNALADFKRQFD